MDILLERIVECIGTKHGAKKELADYLGIHPNVITNWLNGRNKSYKRYVNEISSFYGVSADYLLGKTDQKEDPEQEQIPDVAAFDGFAGESSDEIKNQVEALYVYRTLTPKEIELIKNYRKASQKNKNIVLTLLEES